MKFDTSGHPALISFLAAVRHYRELSAARSRLFVASEKDLLRLEKPHMAFAELPAVTVQEIEQRIGKEVFQSLVAEEEQTGDASHRFSLRLMIDKVDQAEDEVLAPVADLTPEEAAAGRADLGRAAEMLLADSNHQRTIDENIASLAAAVMVAKVSKTDRRVVEVTDKLFKTRLDQHELMARNERQVRAILDWASTHDDGGDTGDIFDSDDPSPHTHPTRQEIPMDTSDTDNDRIGGVIDAISRLQDTVATGGLTQTGAAPVDTGFDRFIDETTYSILGVPSLTSDTALGMNRMRLADKIFSGIDQVIEAVPALEGRDFRFNPAQARLQVQSEGGARGGQAVIAQAVDEMRPAVMAAVARLSGTQCGCSPAEIMEMTRDIEDRLRDISREAASATGVYSMRVKTLLEQLWLSVNDLAAAYGVSPRQAQVKISDLSTALIEGITNTPFARRGKFSKRDACGDPPILQTDTNLEAVRILYLYVDRITLMVHAQGHGTLGSRFSRLHAIVTTISPGANAVRLALRTAGVSPTDLKANFVGQGAYAETIELGRLLDWVNTDAAAWRGRLGDASVTERDLVFLRRSLEGQIAGLYDIASSGKGDATRFSSLLSDNRFAAGRRQVHELVRILQSAIREIDAILNMIGATAPETAA